MKNGAGCNARAVKNIVVEFTVLLDAVAFHASAVFWSKSFLDELRSDAHDVRQQTYNRIIGFIFLSLYLLSDFDKVCSAAPCRGQ